MNPYAQLNQAELIVELPKIAADIHQLYDSLSSEALAWQPAPNEWSIGQCLEHLTLSTVVYFPKIDHILAGKHQRPFWSNVPGFSTFCSDMLLKELTPQATSHLPAPGNVRPSSAKLDPAVLDEFYATLTKLQTYMEACQSLDAATIYITSPFSSLVTYTLLNGYRIIVTHYRHHMTQAQRVLDHPAFPFHAFQANNQSR